MRPNFPSHLTRTVLFDRFRAERYRLEPLVARLQRDIADLAQQGEEQEKKRLPPLELSPGAKCRLARQKAEAAKDAAAAAALHRERAALRPDHRGLFDCDFAGGGLVDAVWRTTHESGS